MENNITPDTVTTRTYYVNVNAGTVSTTDFPGATTIIINSIADVNVSIIGGKVSIKYEFTPKSAIKQKIDPGYLPLILFYLGLAITSIIASYSFYQTLKAN